MRVLYPDAQFAGEPDVELAAAGAGVDLDIHRATDPTAIPAASWPAADGCVVYHEITFTEREIARVERCRIIVRAGVGFDNIDRVACGKRGIAVCNTPDYGTTDVADHAIAMMLTLLRGTASFDEALRADPVENWKFRIAPCVRRVRGQVFGIVGLGRIGTATALRAKAFGLEVIFYDPHLSEGVDLALGVRRVRSLQALLAESDVVSVHTPLSDETRGMLGREALAHLKPGSILVNTARGPVVDPDAVYDALKDGRLAGAGLDVLPVEPPSPDHRLIKAWRAGEDWIKGRLLLSPHAAFYSAAGFIDLRRKSMETAISYLRDGVLRNCVNLDVLDHKEAERRRAAGK